MNPVSHYFFLNTSLEQLYSPILTILFSLFYPIELFLHIIGYGGLLDTYILSFLSLSVNSIDIVILTPYFIYYIFISLLSIWYRYIFILLNISFILFNLYLYTQIY